MAFSIENLLKRPVHDRRGSSASSDSVQLHHPYNPWNFPQTMTDFGIKSGTSPLFPFGPPPVSEQPPVVMPTLADLQLLFGGGGPKAYSRGNRKSGTERKPRQAYSNKQLDMLEDEFQNEKYLTVNKRMELSKALKLTENQIKTWFQNRRTKWKKQMTLSLRHLYRHPVVYPSPYAVAPPTAPIPCVLPGFNGSITAYQDMLSFQGSNDQSYLSTSDRSYQTPSDRSCQSQSDQSQPTHSGHTSVQSMSSSDSDDQQSD